jgi:hypothetical protein
MHKCGDFKFFKKKIKILFIYLFIYWEISPFELKKPYMTTNLPSFIRLKKKKTFGALGWKRPSTSQPPGLPERLQN